MPDSVKISELPPRTALSGDVIPAVDSTFNATVRVTAGQIAALGGGAPRDGSVVTASLVNGAVTYAKIQNCTGLRLLGNSTSSSAVVGEVPVTSWAFTWLTQTSGSNARALLNESTAFTGQCTFDDGSTVVENGITYLLPSIAHAGDTKTGIYFPDKGTVAISTSGFLKFYIDEAGIQYSNIAGQTSTIRAQFGCRAWAAFNGAATGTITINNQAQIAARYGVKNSIWNQGTDSATYTAMEAVENARSPSMSLKNSSNVWQIGSTASDSRANYTSPGDNVHYYYNAGNWTTTADSGKNWIGNISIRATGGTGQAVLASAGVSSVTNDGTGLYRVNFLETMPDANYAVLVSSARTRWDDGGDKVVARTTTYVQVAHAENSPSSGTPTYSGNASTDYMSVAVFR